MDSDEELQEAFAKGLLKPGLNIPVKAPREYKNNVSALKNQINSLKLNLPWVEKLVLTNALAPMAPEMAIHMEQQQEQRAKQLKSNIKGKGKKKEKAVELEDDPVINDFKRESMFYRQAQAAVLKGISQLKELGIPTKRPEDYFGEMVKSDQHMTKVKLVLEKKKKEAQLSERARQQRTQRKMAKEMRISSTLKKHAEKKEMLDEIKKYRKGKTNNLDFLENKKKPVNAGRKMRDKKFGFGGKKRGLKKNDRQSAADLSGYSGQEYSLPGKSGNSKFNKGRNKNQSKTGQKNRPGKSRRVQMKAKRK
ncbi:hypothetical protein TKK_0005878 [Trichogramma kaykai]|uniref:Uncharacterized protein n=1 Tax=Trichogramma kaykai TaxID=54128 RepID=A0ABD2XH42_9HYME